MSEKLEMIMVGKQIRLSQDTMSELKKIGEPFETVDDCLKRVLGCSCVKKEMREQAESEFSDTDIENGGQ